MGDLFEKLIEKKLTRKEQVNELEEVWKFLSKNNLGDLFEKLVEKGVTTLEILHKVSKENVESLDLQSFQQGILLSTLKKVIFLLHPHIFSTLNTVFHFLMKQKRQVWKGDSNVFLSFSQLLTKILKYSKKKKGTYFFNIHCGKFLQNSD